MSDSLALRTARLAYRFLGWSRGAEYATKSRDVLGSEEGNLHLAARLEAGAPCMVSRLGTSESVILLNYLDIVARRSPSLFARQHAVWQGKEAGWKDCWVRQLCDNAGFFNASPDQLEKFSELFLRDLGRLDAAAVWKFVPGENFLLHRYAPEALQMSPGALEPYYFDSPWSSRLKGLRVLVVHPFEKTIRSQFGKRERLFSNPRVLPPFELLTVRAVQGLAGNRPPFETWFAALESMKSQIESNNFDVALIGAGAYGLPLAAHVKRMGKIALHLGGPTQILFGIRGRRWDSMPAIAGLYNEHWVRPDESERIAGGEAVEGGCYW